MGDMMVADQLTVRRWQIIGCYTLIQLLHLNSFLCLLAAAVSGPDAA